MEVSSKGGNQELSSEAEVSSKVMNRGLSS